MHPLPLPLLPHPSSPTPISHPLAPLRPPPPSHHCLFLTLVAARTVAIDKLDGGMDLSASPFKPLMSQEDIDEYESEVSAKPMNFKVDSEMP